MPADTKAAIFDSKKIATDKHLVLTVAHELSSRFYRHVQEGVWKLIPVHEVLLR
jgi:hypothetical protein